MEGLKISQEKCFAKFIPSGLLSFSLLFPGLLIPIRSVVRPPSSYLLVFVLPMR